jgi:hypothetical protein
MLIQKKNVQDFYNEVHCQFPKLKELKIWDKYDWSLEGCEHSMLMTNLSREMAIWATDGDLKETQRLMDFIEDYFCEGDSSVISFLYTDFLVTIMEIENKRIRETIKKMMKSNTAKYYRQLYNFYREAN